MKEAAEKVRYRVAFYGSTPAYRGVFDLHGVGDLGIKLNAMSRQGQWNDMARQVPDDVLDLFVARAPYEGLAEAIAKRWRWHRRRGVGGFRGFRNAGLGAPRTDRGVAENPQSVQQVFIMTIRPFRESTDLIQNGPALADRMREDGYLFLRDLVPEAAIRDLQREVGIIARDAGWLRQDRDVVEAIADPAGFCADPDPAFDSDDAARDQPAGELPIG